MKERLIRKAIIGCASLYVMALLSGLASPVCQADEPALTTFGDGKTIVRFYADYFCYPCQEMEPGIEPVLSDLINQKTIKLIFIDTPFNRYSSLYARYFLYAMNEKKTLENAYLVRKALIEAARKKIVDADKLEAFLNEKKVSCKPFDVKPVFNTLSGYLKQDDINRTPTCVIEMNGKTSTYKGADITDALEKLRQKKPLK
jgi:thiol-disulfide isomerase/thioredoxin